MLALGRASRAASPLRAFQIGQLEVGGCTFSSTATAGAGPSGARPFRERSAREGREGRDAPLNFGRKPFREDGTPRGPVRTPAGRGRDGPPHGASRPSFGGFRERDRGHDGGGSKPSFGLRDPTRSTTSDGAFRDSRETGGEGGRKPLSEVHPFRKAPTRIAQRGTTEDGYEQPAADPRGDFERRGGRDHRDRDSRGAEGRGSKSMRERMMEGDTLLPSRGKGKDRERDRGRDGPRGSGGRTADVMSTMRRKEPKNKGRGVPAAQEQRQERAVYIPTTVNVGRLADIIGVKLYNLQRKMARMDMTEDQQRGDYLLTKDEAFDMALEYNLDPILDDEKSFDIVPEPDAPGVPLALRPPVVTIMGHVDHGKTTLLDSLRHTSVAAGEAGGITQHIGAFSVPLPSLIPSATEGTITFLDTPGHAAFTAMRARGASVTDIVVLVVAADDGVMPQTKEVLDLVKSEGDKVGLVVAINKCDKPGLDFTKVKSALGAEGILLEEDGGDVPAVKVSGLAKTGLDDLVETLSTLAEIRDLRARTTGQAEGYVLESRVDRGRGNVATVLVSKGTLKSGSFIVAGTTWARVRQMQDDLGKPLTSAGPGTPVSITGWKDLPAAGDQLLEAPDETLAKRSVTNRLRALERKKLEEDIEHINVKRAEDRRKHEEEEAALQKVKEEGGDVHALKMAQERHVEEGGKKELLLVIKGDVSGTVEAVVGCLEGIGNAEAGVKIIHTGVGEVSESDIRLAEAGSAHVIGFSVPCPRSIQTLANQSSVPLHLESVIYRLIDTVRGKVAALLPPTIESRVTGEATCQQIFEIKLKGKETMKVAGCKVGNGTINKAEGVRVLRGEERKQVYEGTIETLKHLKKDVGEVRKGTECGISFHGWHDIREGDEIVTFTTFEVPREL